MSHGGPFLAKKTDKNKRLVGIEVEHNARTDLTEWVLKWRGSIHEDGSCGWEAVTTPIAGSHIDHCISDLCEALKGVSADDKCGVHVHVDARDVRWVDMFRLLRVYAFCEPVLYMLAGQHRMNNTYARPMGVPIEKALNNPDPKDAVVSFITNGQYSTGVAGTAGRAAMKARIHKKDNGRYRGLNIMPWLAGRRVKAPDTTVEFRMHCNSLDPKRIAGWAHLCAALVEWCTKASDNDVESLPGSALRALVTVIAPECGPWIMKWVAEWRRVTTASKLPTYDASGGQLADRRIKLKGGVYACVG